jgi:Fe-S cluster assembly protein SufD
MTTEIGQEKTNAVQFAEVAGSGPAWLRELRQAAYTQFSEAGYPTARNEEWRFTPIAPIVETVFVPGDGDIGVSDDYKQYGSSAIEGPHLVLVNGKFRAELSSVGQLPEGVWVASLSTLAQSEPEVLEKWLGKIANFQPTPFAKLNTALFQDGVAVIVPRGVTVEQPIHILHYSSPGNEPTSAHPRLLVVAEESANVTVVETFAGNADSLYWVNAVTEVSVGANAVIDHYKLQRESLSAFHLASMEVHLARDSRFSSHAISLGAAIGRNDIVAYMGGEHAECTLNGLYLADGERLLDTHTTIDHAMPHCDSHELYKGIMDGRGKGVFNGKIFVRLDAQKTDAKQTNKALLLSDDAQINTKPQLEIYADDVKCTHGATVGQLDPKQLFYLRARGIPLEQAKSLLIYAFASDVVSRIQIPSLREELNDLLLAELPKAGE